MDNSQVFEEMIGTLPTSGRETRTKVKQRTAVRKQLRRIAIRLGKKFVGDRRLNRNEMEMVFAGVTEQMRGH